MASLNKAGACHAGRVAFVSIARLNDAWGLLAVHRWARAAVAWGRAQPGGGGVCALAPQASGLPGRRRPQGCVGSWSRWHVWGSCGDLSRGLQRRHVWPPLSGPHWSPEGTESVDRCDARGTCPALGQGVGGVCTWGQEPTEAGLRELTLELDPVARTQESGLGLGGTGPPGRGAGQPVQGCRGRRTPSPCLPGVWCWEDG